MNGPCLQVRELAKKFGSTVDGEQEQQQEGEEEEVEEEAKEAMEQQEDMTEEKRSKFSLSIEEVITEEARAIDLGGEAAGRGDDEDDTSSLVLPRETKELKWVLARLLYKDPYAVVYRDVSFNMQQGAWSWSMFQFVKGRCMWRPPFRVICEI